MQRPNTSAAGSMTLGELSAKNYRKITDASAEPVWRFW